MMHISSINIVPIMRHFFLCCCCLFTYLYLLINSDCHKERDHISCHYLPQYVLGLLWENATSRSISTFWLCWKIYLKRVIWINQISCAHRLDSWELSRAKSKCRDGLHLLLKILDFAQKDWKGKELLYWLGDGFLQGLLMYGWSLGSDDLKT